MSNAFIPSPLLVFAVLSGVIAGLWIRQRTPLESAVAWGVLHFLLVLLLTPQAPMPGSPQRVLAAAVSALLFGAIHGVVAFLTRRLVRRR